MWSIWVDTGGTFTDCVAVDPSGTTHRAKVLSSSALRGRVEGIFRPDVLCMATAWDIPSGFLRGATFSILGRDGTGLKVLDWDPILGHLTLARPVEPPPAAGDAFEVGSSLEAPLLAAHMVTRTPLLEPLPPTAMRVATTRGTNALLQRRGAPVALFITRGFADLLLIGNQQRGDLFALAVEKPRPLFATVVEVAERLAADGSVLLPLDREHLERQAGEVLARGISVAAVALMHSYRNPAHEHEVAAILRDVGFSHVSASAPLAPLIRLLPRAETAVVDATLAPIISGYVTHLREGLTGGRLHVMTSAGGLARGEAYHPKDCLLSGPAGGVVGAAGAGRRSGFARTISFDMGGTSTDVARFDGDYEYLFEHRVGDASLVAPALAIETVAAGGGSICRYDGDRLLVGPESAGASPGPACYGAGGPLTLTDVNLLLGRLAPDRFEIPIAPEAARAALAAVLADMGADADENAILEGFLQIANERMADAIRRISLRRGYDPASYALVAFGGAGGQHACAVASLLGIDTVLVPADAGLLSAEGLGRAVVERFTQRQILAVFQDVERHLDGWLDELAREAIAAVIAEGVPPEEVEVRRRMVNLRFVGQDTALAVEAGEATDVTAPFLESYEALYGYRPEKRPIEVESLRVVASSRPGGDEGVALPVKARPATVTRRTRATVASAVREVPVLDRGELAPGDTLAGPALVFDRHSATVVEPGWTMTLDSLATLVLRHGSHEEIDADLMVERRRPEAVELELFTNRFATIARDMGEMLRRTALSTNVKERLDFSCALLDADGNLVVNAPHIPVHLGSLGVCVRQLCQALHLQEGDVAVTNHPAFGGSHLPDVTVVMPVFHAGRLVAHLANRAHHAEIGGSRPGSMPPAATTLAEEGVVIPPTLLMQRGTPRWDAVRRLLEEAQHPSRAVAENLADLAAAVAANHHGRQALTTLVETHGVEVVLHFMRALEELAERRAREALARLPEGRHEAREELDDGSPLAVAVTVEDGRATVDFSGSAPVHPGNLNATPAIVRSVVLYVLRLLLAEEMPLNEGLLAPVELIIPEGILNPVFPDDPQLAPAIVGGNVETSQRLVDTLLKALGVAACSQGTMNNLVFGNQRFGYYETVCGGSGATAAADGADAVHTHMTNTRITDPEVVEQRYPVRVERFAIRRGSGGDGARRGGDGVIRELTFLEPVAVSLLSQHRTVAPYGVAGGAPGARGAQRLLRAEGEVVHLGAVDGCEAEPGDRLVLETPGGGGWGEPVETP